LDKSPLNFDSSNDQDLDIGIFWKKFLPLLNMGNLADFPDNFEVVNKLV